MREVTAGVPSAFDAICLMVVAQVIRAQFLQLESSVCAQMHIGAHMSGHNALWQGGTWGDISIFTDDLIKSKHTLFHYWHLPEVLDPKWYTCDD